MQSNTSHPLPKNKTKQIFGLVFFLVLCLGVGSSGAWVTKAAIPSWYSQLNQPVGTPPDWIFAPVWTALYTMMAVAAWWVWREKPGKGAQGPLTLFFLQLLLNAFWSWLFFGLKRPDLALVEILVLWTAIGMTVMSFWNVRVLAGALLIPYWVWVSFAVYLNYGFWRLN